MKRGFRLSAALPAAQVCCILLSMGAAVCSPGCSTGSDPCAGVVGAEALTDAARDSAAALLPKPSDWIDVGWVLDTGGTGSWDLLMEGINPVAVVQRDEDFFLYYVGSNDYIVDLDNIGPANRAIGVATSTDGIRWTRYGSGPVIRFSHTGNPEEGAVSAGIAIDTDGTLLAYVGSNIAPDPTSTQVQADIRLATSSDGLRFTPGPLVLSHEDRTVWGSGDELHANLAFVQASRYFVYYVPNGTPQAGQLAFCHGTTRTDLSTCGPVLSQAEPVIARGPASTALLGNRARALFVSNRGTVSAHVISANSAQCLSELGASAAVYEVGGNAVLLHDPARRAWLMYYDQWTHIGLKVAPAGPPDETPPSRPPDLVVAETRPGRVTLHWDAAVDDETGILLYEVHRDGQRIGRALATAYEDSMVRGGTTHEYAVGAVNLHGQRGPLSQVSATVLAPLAAAQSSRHAHRGIDARPTPAAAGAIGYWSMDDPGDLGFDHSGSGHHAAIVGSVAAIAGRVHGAIELDGNGYLEISPAPSLDRSHRGEFTLSAWVRPAGRPQHTDTTNTAYAIFSGPDGLRLRYRWNGAFTLTLGPAQSPVRMESSPREPSEWMHVAVVLSASQKQVALYVDGEQAPGSPLAWDPESTRVPLASPNYARHHSYYRIGIGDPRFSLDSHPFRGRIDEVTVYGRALSAVEVQALR